jgi:hypothetical protein
VHRDVEHGVDVAGRGHAGDAEVDVVVVLPQLVESK